MTNEEIQALVDATENATSILSGVDLPTGNSPLELMAKKAIRERNELAAWIKDAMRELTSLQQVTHQLAHNGSMCWDYSRDAKAVMDREPKDSLARRDARMKAEALEELRDLPIWGSKSAVWNAVKSDAAKYRKQAGDAS